MFSRKLFATLAAAPLLCATELSDAVQSQNRPAIARLLKPATVNEADADGSTPLHWAARNGDLDTVRMLLKAGAKASAANRLGVTPLWLAVTNRNTEVTASLLNSGADSNAKLETGETILAAAARSGDGAIIEQLIEHRALLDAPGSQFGETPLMIAAAANQPAAVEALTRHGAAIDVRSKSLTYPKDRFGLEGVLTILPHGNWTPLMYAARQGATEAIAALVKTGAQLDLTDPEGTTPLILAVINGHFDSAALLIEKGSDINHRDNAGMGPLYAAVDMNTLGEVFGRPPRAPSGKLSGLDLIKLLLARGADPNARLSGPAIQRAHTPGEPTLTDGATALMRAAKNGDAAAMELLIAGGADVNAAQKNGATALMFACGLGRGVSAFAKDYGTEADLLAGAKVLVAHGANVNAPSVAGITPIHYAAQAADANFPQPTDAMLRYLLAQGASVSVTDKQGRTPVDMAMGKGLRGRAGGPVKPREETAEMLRALITAARTPVP